MEKKLQRNHTTLLILANKGDEAAERFDSFCRSLRIQTALITDLRHMHLTISANRMGAAAVQLRVRPRGAIVGAVCNFGLTPTRGGDWDFRSGELLASWWSALALFPGPVLNRPTLSSFVPEVQPLSLCSKVPNLDMPDSWISPEGARVESPETTNVHLLSSGAFLGRTDGGPITCQGELCRFTTFNPNSTWRLLVAGKSLFPLDMANMSSDITEKRRAMLERLRGELTKTGPLFCVLVLSDTEDGIALLAGHPFPHYSQYRHIDKVAHNAALEGLTGC